MIKRNTVLKKVALGLFLSIKVVETCDPRIVEGPNPWCQEIIEIANARVAYFEDKTIKLQEILDTNDPNVLKSLPLTKDFEDLVSLKIWASNALETSENNKVLYTDYLTLAGRLKAGEEDVSQAFEVRLKDLFEYLFRRYQNAEQFLKGSYKGFVITFPPEDIQRYKLVNQQIAQQCIDDFSARSRILKILYQHTSPEDYTQDTSKILAVAPEWVKYLNAPDFESVIPDDTRWGADLMGYLDLYYYKAKVPNFLEGKDEIQWVPKDHYQEFVRQKMQEQQAFCPRNTQVVGVFDDKKISRQQRRAADKKNKKFYGSRLA